MSRAMTVAEVQAILHDRFLSRPHHVSLALIDHKVMDDGILVTYTEDVRIESGVHVYCKRVTIWQGSKLCMQSILDTNFKDTSNSLTRGQP